MHPPLHPWPDTILSKNILLFAQTVRELLDDSSFESFRVYALDTPSRILEAINVLESVQNGLPYDVMRPIIGEIKWSIQNDLLLDSKAKAEIYSIIIQIEDPKSIISESQAKLNYINSKHLSGYKEQLENKAIELIKLDKDKHILRQLASAYCTRLINIGYSRRFLINEIETHFLNKKGIHPKSSSLKSFFKSFTNSNKKYLIYFLVNKEFGSYLGFNNYNIYRSTTETPADVIKVFSSFLNFTQHVIASSQVSAKDFFEAMKITKSNVESYEAITYLDRSNFVCSWYPTMYVKDIKSKRAHILPIAASEAENLRSKISTERTVERIKGYSRTIHQKFNAPSLERILSAISTLALAVNSRSVENRIISMWSSFEVLLSSPPAGKPRILHYTRLLVPCICTKHFWLHIISVSDKLYEIYGKPYTKILDKEPNSIGKNIHPHWKFAAILLLDQNKILRDQLCQLCKDNPLALQRMTHIHRNLSTPKTLLKLMEEHQDRVEWQLHRIYRARNNIVHAGQVPTYLESIIRNAFEYFRSAMVTIVAPSIKGVKGKNIDDAVIEAALRYNEKKRQLDTMDSSLPLTFNDLKSLF